MNKETIEEYKGKEIIIIEAPCTDGSVLYGYRLPEIFGVICYNTYNGAFSRAKKVIDNPKLINSMISSEMILPNPKWFK